MTPEYFLFLFLFTVNTNASAENNERWLLKKIGIKENE